MLRLLRLTFMYRTPMPLVRSGPVWRLGSPSGASTLITSAPMSPRICAATGPMMLMVRSTTRTPASGPVGLPFISIMWRNSLRSLDPEVGRLDDLLDLRHLVPEDGHELLRRGDVRLDPHLAQP